LPYKDPQRAKENRRKYYLENKEKILEQCKEYREKNSERKKQNDKIYYQRNREKIMKRNQQWKKDNPEYQKEWFENHPDYKKEWYWENREKETANIRRRKKHAREKIISIINEYKNKPCALCGIQLPPVCMDLHHINPSVKLYNIASMRRSIVSIARIVEEMEKCIIICTNCHLELSINGYKKFPKWFVEYKSKLICENCGINKSLEFHHRDPSTKLYGVSSMVTTPKKFPREMIMNEIKKCKVLCRCCHRLEHFWN